MTKEYIERKKLLYKLCVAKSDITSAMIACNYLITSVKDTDDPLYLPLLNAIIVCYWRPFSNNFPLGPLPKKWNNFRNKKNQTIHSTLSTFRDKIVAHSDLEYRTVFVYPRENPLTTPAGEFPGLSVTVTEKRLPLYFFPEIYQHCIDLINRFEADIQENIKYLFSSEKPPDKKFKLTF